MPSSNYGPLIDPDAPPFVQNLYVNQVPDFVFQANNPKKQGKRIGAIINLAITLVVLAFVAGSFQPFYNMIVAQFTQYSISPVNIIETIKTEYAKDPETATTVLIGGSIIALLIIGSFLKNIIKNISLILENEKIWYVATLQNLAVIKGKKPDYIGWKQFTGEIKMESGPLGDTLTLKLKPGQSINELVMANPPNIMEIKRLCEKRIKVNPETPPDNLS